MHILGDADAILVPGGFGERGSEGKIKAITIAAAIAILGYLFRDANGSVGSGTQYGRHHQCGINRIR